MRLGDLTNELDGAGDDPVRLDREPKHLADLAQEDTDRHAVQSVYENPNLSPNLSPNLIILAFLRGRLGERLSERLGDG